MVRRNILVALLAALFIQITSASYAITGVQTAVNHATGERPARQDFSKFQNAGPAWDLYVQALIQFYADGQTKLLSYYQVAGIHGYPDVVWDGSTGGDFTSGYCTHASILFPTWHRPYLALYEQILWKNAQKIALTYPAANRAQYVAAAKTFRMPYWDWAKNSTMPTKFLMKTTIINTPTGRRSVTNPFYSYTFHPHPSAADFPPGDGISQFLSTVRYPKSLAPNAVSQNELVNRQLKANQQSLHDLTYQLLASQKSYAPFSNTGFTDKNGNTYNSIENMHNIVHSLVGNGGHMSYVPYAAFDPIFWLHHCNVDRLVAIWQALNPNSFTTPQVNEFGTFTNRAGTIEDINTKLTPFHSDTKGTFYTSATARKTLTFGYTYPEVIDWGVSAAQLSKNVRTAINKLYNPKGTIASSKRSRIARSMEIEERGVVNTNELGYQWAINLRSDTSKIPSSIFLHFYLTTPPASPADWSASPDLVASLSVVPPPPTSRARASVFINGQLPLTAALLPFLKNLNSAEVLPFLKKNLQWRAQKFDDSPVDNKVLGDAGAINLRLVGRAVQGASGPDEFPTYGEWKREVDITMGKGEWGLL